MKYTNTCSNIIIYVWLRSADPIKLYLYCQSNLKVFQNSKIAKELGLTQQGKK